MSSGSVGRGQQEVVIAACIFVGVLAVIDAFWLAEPRLVLALVPFVFLLLAALVRLTPRLIGAWIAAIGLLALLSGQYSYAGLAASAGVVLVLVLLQRSRGRR